MANTAIEIPFYVAKDGSPLTGAAAEMNFESLKTVSGTDEIGSAPSISEIGGGWYKFSVAYGTAPFDSGDLVGVIDADKNGNNNLASAERYIPVEARLDFYGLLRSVYKMTQDKLTGDMEIKDSTGNTILKLDITDSDSEVIREPVAE
ncbi:MAG: hypothetical protein KKE31_01485 [Planctomycetes bacterium]|nr:hypothetical protein [Planctomycetota bacterium]MBU1517792.1 hypothetical protein [Planctomycetota bacterium]MBU2457293.1 hypothetical protein [Planctomycetota bacterium]